MASHFYHEIISECQHPNSKVSTSKRIDICQTVRSKSLEKFDYENT